MSNEGIVALGFSLIFLFTCAGSATVYLFRGEISPKLNTLFLGFAAGVMIAATIWSLLLPSMEGALEIFDYNKYLSVLPAAVGFIVGGLFLVLLDKVIPHFHFGTDKEEGHRSNFQKTTKFFLAVTIHNIPEGLAVGVAFGALMGGGEAGLAAAAMLAIGIGIQNFPEGMCVAFPLRANGMSRAKSFFIGQLSGAVEIVAGVIGALAVTVINWLLPFALAFSSGAMIAVVCAELVPESFAVHKGKATAGIVLGFALMMILDIAFG